MRHTKHNNYALFAAKIHSFYGSWVVLFNNSSWTNVAPLVQSSFGAFQQFPVIRQLQRMSMEVSITALLALQVDGGIKGIGILSLLGLIVGVTKGYGRDG